MKMIIIQWITHTMQNNRTLMQQVTMFLMFQFINKHCFPSMRKIDMVILAYSLNLSSDLMKVFVQLIFGQKKILQYYGK